MRTWVFRIVTNRAKARGVREARFIPLPSIGAAGQSEPSPERSALTGEIRGHVTRALSLLPDRQRAVVTLRDVTGLTPDEVCHALDISSANQRVLLHRGRAALRATLQDFYSSDGAA